MKRKFKAFSILEVLIALSIIAVAVTAVVTVLANTQRGLRQDKDLQFSVDFSNRYFTEVYISGDIRKKLFTDDEILAMEKVRRFPYRAEAIVTNLSDRVKAVISRKVNRWEPLLVDIGLEIVISAKEPGMIDKDFWFETSFSDIYLKKQI